MPYIPQSLNERQLVVNTAIIAMYVVFHLNFAAYIACPIMSSRVSFLNWFGLIAARGLLG